MLLVCMTSIVETSQQPCKQSSHTKTHESQLDPNYHEVIIPSCLIIIMTVDISRLLSFFRTRWGHVNKQKTISPWCAKPVQI